MEAPGGTALVEESLKEALDFRRAMRKVDEEWGADWWFKVWGPDDLSEEGIEERESWMLKAGERSHWHRVNADEAWHFYAGASLELSTSEDGRTVRNLRLGTDLDVGEQPQAVVPRHVWQAARSLGAWTLVGCTVAPAFEFSGFELAPPGWQPGR